MTLLIFILGFTPGIQPLPAYQDTISTLAPAPALCLPGVYLTDPQDCLPLGPSSYMTQMAGLGISFPLLSLPAHPIDASLGEIPFNYADLGATPTPVYASLQDAVEEKNSIKTIEAGGLRYITYVDYTDTANGRIFRLHDDTWVRVSSRVSVPHSFPGGIELSRTPDHSFGWVLPFQSELETRRTPGFNPEEGTGYTLHQYQVVQVYSSQVVNNTEWDLVAPDEWVEARFIGRVIPNTTPPPGLTTGRWIEVNLFEQTLAVYDHNRMVYATLIATGLDPFFTKPGLFQIQRKLDSTPMSGSFAEDRTDYYYLEDVPWTMYYDHARALHGAYWRTAFGFPQSHGCVNLAPADAHWLFDWANVGDWVYVWDPSGNTPTDPDYYGEGGA
jgi:hypothetical protein